MINPIQSEAFRKMYIRQTKNDSKDSFIIAQVMRFGQYSATTLSEKNIVTMRQLSRYRLALVDSCGDCKRRVIALLDQVFPEYDKLFSDTFGATSKELLLKYPTFRTVAADSFGVGFAKNAFSFQIRQLIEQLMFLENQIEELEEQISYLLHQTNEVITTIPGIGDILGAIILS